MPPEAASPQTAPAPAGWPDLLGYYPAWLAYRRWVDRVPGVQVALRRGGELRLSAALGRADLAEGTALGTDHLFRIASHSKTFTAVLVLQLVEQGRLRLDDTVVDHVPELQGSPVADRTLEDLLAHGGGVIRDSEDGDFWQVRRPFPDREELLDVAGRASTAVIGPSEHFKYSNIAYGLLGLVLAAVTGSSFAELVAERVAEPLGLRDTGGELDPARAGDYAAGHTSLATSREREVIPHVDTRALAAATGCYATAADLTAFFSALLPGQHALLGAVAQRRQRHPRWEVRAGQQRYGLGVFLDTIAGTELFGHTGGYPGHITCTHADPADGWVLSVLTNAVDGPASSMAGGFFKLLGLGRDATHARCEADAVRFTGRFASSWGLVDVVRLDDRLFMLDPTSPDPAEDAVPLEVHDDAALRIVGGRGGGSYRELVRYEFAPDGAVTNVRGDSGVSMAPWVVPGDD